MKTFLLTSVMIGVLGITSATWTWMTKWDQPINFECPEGEILEFIESTHDNKKEDRLFNFGCKRTPYGAPLIDCHWTGYINDWDALLVYQCLDDDIITGVHSVHNNKKEDRRYKLKCCRAQGVWAHACEYAYLNNWDAYFYHRIPDGTGIKGIVSVHNNHKEDRRYWLEVCRLDNINTEADVLS